MKIIPYLLIIFCGLISCKKYQVNNEFSDPTFLNSTDGLQKIKSKLKNDGLFFEVFDVVDKRNKLIRSALSTNNPTNIDELISNQKTREKFVNEIAPIDHENWSNRIRESYPFLINLENKNLKSLVSELYNDYKKNKFGLRQNVRRHLYMLTPDKCDDAYNIDTDECDANYAIAYVICLAGGWWSGPGAVLCVVGVTGATFVCYDAAGKRLALCKKN